MPHSSRVVHGDGGSLWRQISGSRFPFSWPSWHQLFAISTKLHRVHDFLWKSVPVLTTSKKKSTCGRLWTKNRTGCLSITTCKNKMAKWIWWTDRVRALDVLLKWIHNLHRNKKPLVLSTQNLEVCLVWLSGEEPRRDASEWAFRLNQEPAFFASPCLRKKSDKCHQIWPHLMCEQNHSNMKEQHPTRVVLTDSVLGKRWQGHNFVLHSLMLNNLQAENEKIQV